MIFEIKYAYISKRAAFPRARHFAVSEGNLLPVGNAHFRRFERQLVANRDHDCVGIALLSDAHTSGHKQPISFEVQKCIVVLVERHKMLLSDLQVLFVVRANNAHMTLEDLLIFRSKLSGSRSNIKHAENIRQQHCGLDGEYLDRGTFTECSRVLRAREEHALRCRVHHEEHGTRRLHIARQTVVSSIDRNMAYRCATGNNRPARFRRGAVSNDVVLDWFHVDKDTVVARIQSQSFARSTCTMSDIHAPE